MNDYIESAPAPADEQRVQMSHDGDYTTEMRAECRRYLSLIRDVLGPEPEGTRLEVKEFTHDSGGYCEVVCHYTLREGAAPIVFTTRVVPDLVPSPIARSLLTPIAAYEDGVCPDCREPIPEDVESGQECDGCGHVFWGDEDS